MPMVLAALCIPCILNIDLCCLCVNSKPEINLYLKLHLVLGEDTVLLKLFCWRLQGIPCLAVILTPL